MSNKTSPKDTQFKPGVSGNPTGLSKERLALRDTMLAAGPAAWKKIVDFAQGDDPKLSFAAAELILKYAAGMPPKATEDRDETYTAFAMALAAVAAKKA